MSGHKKLNFIFIKLSKLVRTTLDITREPIGFNTNNKTTRTYTMSQCHYGSVGLSAKRLSHKNALCQ